MRPRWIRAKSVSIYICRLAMMPIILPCALVWAFNDWLQDVEARLLREARDVERALKQRAGTGRASRGSISVVADPLEPGALSEVER